MFHHHFPYPIVLPWLVYYCPARPCRYRGKGQDGSDPPPFAASAANMAGGWGRVCYMVWGTPCPPYGNLVATVQNLKRLVSFIRRGKASMCALSVKDSGSSNSRFRPIHPCGKARIKAHAQQRIRAGERPDEMVSSGWFWLLFQGS